MCTTLSVSHNDTLANQTWWTVKCVLPAGSGTEINVLATVYSDTQIFNSVPQALVSYMPPIITQLSSEICEVTDDPTILMQCSRTDSGSLT